MTSFGFSNFDFNVQNYSNEELEDLLGLKKNYTVNDIISNKQKLCIQIASAAGSIQKQPQMSEFLDAASKCLISTLGSGSGSGSGSNSNSTSSSSSGSGSFRTRRHRVPVAY